jgi:hypothetical protein
LNSQQRKSGSQAAALVWTGRKTLCIGKDFAIVKGYAEFGVFAMEIMLQTV